MPRMETIVVIDDHAPFRARVRAMLEAEGFDVLGEAVGVSTGLELVTRLRPAIVLIDVGLPDGDGFELAALLAAEPAASDSAVVLVSSREEVVYRSRLASANIAGFLPKDDLSGAAIRALIPSAIADGGAS